MRPGRLPALLEIYCVPEPFKSRARSAVRAQRSQGHPVRPHHRLPSPPRHRPHTFARGQRALPRTAWLAAVLLVAGCDSGGAGPHAGGGSSEVSSSPEALPEPLTEPLPEAPPTDRDRADLEALVAAFQPVDPTATSDVQDAWMAEQRRALAGARERVRDGGAPGLARLALETYEARARDPETSDEVRIALLEVAAHGLGEAAAPRLERLVTTYDSDLGLRLRTAAVRILAGSAPERALAFLAPLCREDRPSATRPPQAALVEAWIAAARLVRERGGEADTRVLADVATNIFQPADARYAALDGLGELGGPLAATALEEVLAEASSDGYVRRKAAQALAACSEPEAFCPILARLASHESDPVFLYFLSDMLDRRCAGVEPEAELEQVGHEGHDH